MNFERGINPKKVLGLGQEKVLEDMGGILFTEKNLYKNMNYFLIEDIHLQNIKTNRELLYQAYIIIVIIGDQFRILKNRIGNDKEIYPLKELPSVIFKLKKEYNVWKNS